MHASIDDANHAISRDDCRRAAQAGERRAPPSKVIDVLAGQPKVLLHAGPPISFLDMTPPMQASCVGAEPASRSRQRREARAHAVLSLSVTFAPCHHHDAVGPMGGITSPSMAVLVVENGRGGNRAYCTME